jgi:hypothetical protein
MDAASLANLVEALKAPAPIDGSGEGLWPEHVATVQAFLFVCTQWRVVPVGGGFAASRILTIGFDYAGVRAGLDAEGIEVTPELWRGLRVMEQEAVAALNEGS